MIDDVYNAKILEFAGNIPRIGSLEDADATARAHSKLCGSTVMVWLKMDGDVVNARELYRKILRRITTTVPICGTISRGVHPPSVWWSECGHHSASLPEYSKGRKELIQEFGFADVDPLVGG